MDFFYLQILSKPNVDTLKKKVLIYSNYIYDWDLSISSLKKTLNHISLKLAMLFISKSGFSSNILPKLLLKLASKVNKSIYFYEIWQNNKEKWKRKNNKRYVVLFILRKYILTKERFCFTS